MLTLVLAITAATFALAAPATWWFVRSRRLNEVGVKLRRCRRTEVAHAPEGEEVKIVGELSYAGEPLTAPLSGRPCACWEVVVEERFTGGGDRWYPLVRRHDAQQFFVEDETGRARVEAKVWGLEVVEDFKQRTGLFHEASAEVQAFLKRQRIPMKGLGTERFLRYREGVLEAGERVAIYGCCQWEPDPDAAGAAYREAPTRLVIGSEISGVLVSDDPRALKS